jgi:urea transporter
VAEALTRSRRVVERQLAAISQTFFVYNSWVGLAALAVLAAAAPHLAVAGLVASVLTRLAAAAMGASPAFLGTGLAELNGWFLGLACGTFFAVGPGLAVAVLLGSILVALITIAMHRALSVWDVPAVIGPYVPTFWILWSSIGALPWGKAAILPVVPPAPPSPLMLVLLGGLRGVGQIFFLPDASVGLALAVAASIADLRLGVAMIAASVAAVGVGYLAGTPLWQVETGLAGFTPALISAAARYRFAGLGWGAVMVTVVSMPFLEAAAIRLAGAVGVHALSAPYICLIWTFALLRPLREASAAATDWPIGFRPSLFGNGLAGRAASARGTASGAGGGRPDASSPRGDGEDREMSSPRSP